MNIEKETIHKLELSQNEIKIISILMTEPEKYLKDKQDIKQANHLAYRLWVGSEGKNKYTLQVSQKEFDILLDMLTLIDIFKCLDNKKDTDQASELIFALINYKLLAFKG